MNCIILGCSYGLLITPCLWRERAGRNFAMNINWKKEIVCSLKWITLMPMNSLQSLLTNVCVTN